MPYIFGNAFTACLNASGVTEVEDDSISTKGSSWWLVSVAGTSTESSLVGELEAPERLGRVVLYKDRHNAYENSTSKPNRTAWTLTIAVNALFYFS